MEYWRGDREAEVNVETYIGMRLEIETLRKTKLYKRLLEFEENIKTDKIYTRNDLGF